jgi:two-component system response regulator YesN
VRDQTLDALITDVRLGAFNGLQLAVMARDIQPNIQVIVFSGFDDPVLRADAERIGATYLVKPVPSSYLIQLLQSSTTPKKRRKTAIAASDRRGNPIGRTLIHRTVPTATLSAPADRR